MKYPRLLIADGGPSGTLLLLYSLRQDPPVDHELDDTDDLTGISTVGAVRQGDEQLRLRGVPGVVVDASLARVGHVRGLEAGVGDELDSDGFLRLATATVTGTGLTLPLTEGVVAVVRRDRRLQGGESKKSTIAGDEVELAVFAVLRTARVDHLLPTLGVEGPEDLLASPADAGRLGLARRRVGLLLAETLGVVRAGGLRLPCGQSRRSGRRRLTLLRRLDRRSGLLHWLRLGRDRRRLVLTRRRDDGHHGTENDRDDDQTTEDGGTDPTRHRAQRRLHNLTYFL